MKIKLEKSDIIKIVAERIAEETGIYNLDLLVVSEGDFGIIISESKNVNLRQLPGANKETESFD